MAVGDVVDMDEVEPAIENAGILPFAASTMIRPVGVGFTSRGPIGVEGLTITAGRPRARSSLDQPLGYDLGALVGADAFVGHRRRWSRRRVRRRAA